MKPLSPHTMQIKGQLTVEYEVVVPYGTKLADILIPEYWQHHSTRLKPSDTILIHTEDMTFRAVLIVMEVGHLAVKVRPLQVSVLQDTDEAKSMVEITEDDIKAQLPAAEQYDVEWISPKDKFGVKRGDQNEWVKKGLPSKVAAEAWVKQDMKTMAA